ncbi:hypothetical protein WKW80_26975 [Variovorax humicola]|uniref:Uncharacterized protein n=1 Tax=Variovorax humicola TaxID=1769758 RepID=A0ABU8W6U4_9BURK
MSEKTLNRTTGDYMRWATVERGGDSGGNSEFTKFTFSCDQPAEVGANDDGSVFIKFVGALEMAEVTEFLKKALGTRNDSDPA